MKYLKKYESVGITDEEVLEINKTIFNDIDILQSFEEYLKDMGFKSYGEKDPYFLVSLSGGNRLTLEDFGKFINDRIDIEIKTLTYNISATIDDGDEGDFNDELESFTNRLNSMTSCRIDNINININKKYSKIYTKGDFSITNKSSITLSMTISNLSKRYQR